MRKGNVFTSVCQEFCPQGRGCLPLGLGVVYTSKRDPLRQSPPPSLRQTSPLGWHPLPSGRHPTSGPHQRDSHCSGWYASYWNAFLFKESLCFLWYFRLAWVIIVVTAVILFTYQVAERTTDYFGYNTTVSVNIRYVAEVPFPAVTLCNINTFKLVYS